MTPVVSESQLADLVSWLLVLTELADSWLILQQALTSLLSVRSVVQPFALSRTAGEVVSLSPRPCRAPQEVRAEEKSFSGEEARGERCGGIDGFYCLCSHLDVKSGGL